MVYDRSVPQYAHNGNGVSCDDLGAMHGCCLVEHQLICLRIKYQLIRHASWPIEYKREKLTNASPPDMQTDTLKPHPACLLLRCNSCARWSSATPCRELLCRCNCSNDACWPSATATNKVVVQTFLLVECYCNMGTCWNLATQSAWLSIFCHSIIHVRWCGASLSTIPAGVMSHYQSYLWCLTIGHAFWCGSSLSAILLV